MLHLQPTAARERAGLLDAQARGERIAQAVFAELDIDMASFGNTLGADVRRTIASIAT